MTPAERTAKWRRDHPERAKATYRNYQARNRDRWHGVSKSALVAAQNGLCAICGKQPAIQVDHDHAHCPGRLGCPVCVRGVLCFACNRGLGSFHDSIDTLRRAIEYLIRWTR